MCVVLIIRLGVLAAVWFAWFKRRKRLKRTIAARKECAKPAQQPVVSNRAAAKNALLSRWFPLIPVLSTIDMLLQIIFFVLASLNAISTTSGKSIPIICFWVVIVCVIQFFALKKVVGLGARLFKFGDQRLNGSSALSSFDGVLKIISLVCSCFRLHDSTFCNEHMKLTIKQLMWVLMATATGMALYIGITNDDSRKREMVRAGLICFVLQSLLFHFSLFHQYRRVIDCVVEAHQQVRWDSFKRALDVLRYNQLAIALSTIPIIAMYIYFAVTLRYHYWLIPMTFGVEGLLYASMVGRELSYAKKSEQEDRHKHHTASSTLLTGGGAHSPPGPIPKQVLAGGEHAMVAVEECDCEAEQAK